GLATPPERARTHHERAPLHRQPSGRTRVHPASGAGPHERDRPDGRPEHRHQRSRLSLMLVRLYAVAASAQIVQAILSAGALLLLARLLSPSELGIYLLLFSTATIVAVAVAAGPHAAHLILAARTPASRPALNGQGAL